MEKKTGTHQFYADNLNSALPIIKKAVKDGLTTVAFDFEFPGMIYSTKVQPTQLKAFYAYTKKNVDALKPIQLGLTLFSTDADKKSEFVTLEFNLEFDIDNDLHTQTSFGILTNAGLDFELLKSKGIDREEMKNFLNASKLFRNPEITWVAFHGNFDLCYMLKLLTMKIMPKKIEELNSLKKMIFPHIYDIKIMLQGNYLLRLKSLTKVADYYKISTEGDAHQAGYDSKLTAKIWIEINKEDTFALSLSSYNGRIYGLSSHLPGDKNFSSKMFDDYRTYPDFICDFD